jgi:hypothetical protein
VQARRLLWYACRNVRITGRVVCGSVLLLFSFVRAPATIAQEAPEHPVEEVVANLAAGRVVIAVVKDAMIIGTIENPIETGTHPPTPVQLSSRRAAIALGAVDWFSPSSQQQLARFDRDLPRATSGRISRGPTLQQPHAEVEAVDIEAIGEGMADRLKEVTQSLHSPIELPAGEPLVEIIVADFLAGYGPEVWQITFSIEQQPVRLDYLDTRILPPHYVQFWPPEKGHPHTLVEFRYPPGNNLPSILDLLRQNDPRLEKIRNSDAKMGEVARRLLEGESAKILSADAIQFLRGAMAAVAPPNARQTMAIIGFETGFDWILAPPPEPKQPGKEKERSPGAPSLLKPPS